MVPNYLYLTITNNSSLALNAPNLVLNLSKNVFWALVVLWFLGFAFIMASTYIQHFRFRGKILKDTYEVSDSRIRGIWEEEIAKLRIKKPVFKLIVSKAVSAPLTIGFFNKTMRVVLPPIEYSNDDLRLIFRHELIHICRQDAMNKFFLTFSKAMCWFNPLMWIAVEKCSEDIELSCDETLLLEANEDHRKRYAHLLLNTSQESRGFTTC
jgi:beta-lactamase regulating signal transducer with metallopeptidase domain